MMGFGIDLVHVPEFQAALDDPTSFFFDRYFTANEASYCRGRPASEQARHFAVRYAAREALVKAMDGGRLHQPPAFTFDYREAEVRRDDHGRPFLFATGAVRDYLAVRGVQRIHLSLTHTGDYALAGVMLESKGTRNTNGDDTITGKSALDAMLGAAVTGIGKPTQLPTIR